MAKIPIAISTSIKVIPLRSSSCTRVYRIAAYRPCEIKPSRAYCCEASSVVAPGTHSAIRVCRHWVNNHPVTRWILQFAPVVSSAAVSVPGSPSPPIDPANQEKHHPVNYSTFSVNNELSKRAPVVEQHRHLGGHCASSAGPKFRVGTKTTVPDHLMSIDDSVDKAIVLPTTRGCRSIANVIGTQRVATVLSVVSQLVIRKPS